MKIELKPITVRELTKDYKDNADNGVIGYGSKLDIRPPYQREFIYKDFQRNAVIDTVQKEFPLNVMYWAVRNDGNFEIIDGQQRTISICQYVNGDYSIDGLSFFNLTDDKQEQILNYRLMVYFCSGEDSEKLKWFETINIAGEELTKQELRNAVYSGTWVSDAKIYFSKRECVASKIGGDYLNGSANRQEYLERVIIWISDDSKSKTKIEDYMSVHQHDSNANALRIYFQSVISWIDSTFIVKRKKFMKGVEWGIYFNKFKDVIYNTKLIEEETAKLMADDDVENKKGIYPFILTRDEKYLSIRAFSDSMKQKVYERQKGICPICKNNFNIEEMEGDHIKPFREGGKTTEENCQMLCKKDNRAKSGK